MADMYTTVSFEIAMTAVQATKSSEIYEAYEEDRSASEKDANFEIEFDDESIHVSGDNVDVGELQAFLLGLGKDVGLTGTLVVEWAQHCSKKAPGEFGGGAFAIDFDRSEIVSEMTTSRLKDTAEAAKVLTTPTDDLRVVVATYAAAAAHAAMLDFYDRPDWTTDEDAIRRIAAALAEGYVPHVQARD